MKLVIASNNAHKTAEIKAILGGYFDEILSLAEAGISADVVEDGETFEANALKKAVEVLRIADADAVLSDDSGLAVDALSGAPGVCSARYAGAGHDDEANNDKLLQAMENVPDEARTCRFVSAVALARRQKAPIVCRGEAEGVLLRARTGKLGFGYDPLFYYPSLGKTFAQMGAEEKNAVSHRKRALEALHDALEREESAR